MSDMLTVSERLLPLCEKVKRAKRGPLNLPVRRMYFTPVRKRELYYVTLSELAKHLDVVTELQKGCGLVFFFFFLSKDSFITSFQN